MPRVYPSRNAFTAQVLERGFTQKTAQWLGMNLSPGDGQYALRLDATSIEALLRDHHQLDFWSELASLPMTTHVVLGERSDVHSAADVTRLRALSGRRPDRLQILSLAGAGHWFHVEAPEELLQVFLETLPRRCE